ncbi:hypothetical protein [Egicoccus sp. AB-alg2]|uniref:hypothetical protein n=1 Tax=Egicoccus sp. AB-alg2 TaxID=3242693 RepID=UPI00359EAAC7
MGLDADGIVQRIRELAREQAARLPLSVGATDGQLEQAIEQVSAAIHDDRRLRRFFRQGEAASGIARSLVTWEILVAAVGERCAEARLNVLRGLPPPRSPLAEQVTEAQTELGPRRIPGSVVESSRRVKRRAERLPPPTVADKRVLRGLREAVSVQPTEPDDPVHAEGYDHAVWLEDWLGFAVGDEALADLEGRIAAHPEVLAAEHEDRECLFVAAPDLHPEDVRRLVIDLLAPTFDGDWEARV